MFSFYLTSKPNQPGSFVTFGGYDLSKYAKPGAKADDIFWGTIVHSERYWTLNMAQVSLNEQKDNQVLEDIKARYAIMDTGVSYAIIPVDDFLLIKEYLKSNFSVSCKEPEKSSLTSTHTCTCPDHDILPDIQISLQQSEGSTSEKKTFTLPKESYMEKVGQGCNTLRLTPSTERFG